MEPSTNEALGFAHGKIILIGEHSVVYNEPAIAIPFTSAKVRVKIEKIADEVKIDSLYYKGKLKNSPEKLRNLRKTLDAVSLNMGEKVYGMKISIHSDIPAERGMGSSAAVATALVRALFNYYNKKLTKDLLDRFVRISEEIAHGNPSGIDAKVVQSKQAIYFVRGKKTRYFDSQMPAYLVLADTGQKGETYRAVKDVAKLLADERTPGKQWVQALGQLTVKAHEKIKNKEIKELGKIMTQAHLLLKKLRVSNDALDQLVETALANHALGAKLTGGGRGGCMIALVENLKEAEKLSTKLLEANASKTWIHPLGGNINGK